LISLQVSPTAASFSLTYSFSSFSVCLIYSILEGFQLTDCFTLPNDSFISTSNPLCYRFLLLIPPQFFA
jgi:hypothetical protein